MNSFEAWIGNCILRDDRSGVLHQSTVVVWADGYATYRSGVEAEILHRDLTLIQLGNVSPIQERSDTTSSQLTALAGIVHSGNPVEIGTLEPFARADDKQSYLTIDELPVEPLDRQSGAWPMKNVPDALYDPLFGQPAPTEAEIAHYGGLEHVPPMKTYAILDASKFQSGLSEFEDCGLPFRCLFKGDAAEEQKDVAPYLFELKPDSPFVRRLFTHLPDMPETMTTVHMWHREPGIYLRSRVEFEDVWKHFRKFTKVPDENGNWYYFRFWEPKSARDICGMMLLNQSDFPAFLQPRGECPFPFLFAITGGLALKISQSATGNESVKAPFILTAHKQAALNQGRRTTFERDFAQKLFDMSPTHREWLGNPPLSQVEACIISVANMAKDLGFVARNEIAKLASFSFFHGTYAINDPRLQPIRQTFLQGSQHSSIVRIQKFSDVMDQHRSFGLMSDETLRLALTALPKVALDGPKSLRDLAHTHPKLMPQETSGAFRAACAAQGRKWGLKSEKAVYSHALSALVFTPFFLEDPLHEKLRQFFTGYAEADMMPRLIEEFERRLAID